VVRAAKRIQVGVCGAAFMKWAEAACSLSRSRILIGRVRSFRVISCVRLVFRCWSRICSRMQFREFLIRSYVFRFQSKQTSLFVFVFRLFLHWRRYVAAKKSSAIVFYTNILLRSAMRSFVCFVLHRRSKSKELLLACTLLDQVSYIFVLFVIFGFTYL
jgi:hypothetical protein